MSIYVLNKVRQTYGERTVLQVDSLSIEPGEIFAIVGPSGAGKSTLLHLLGLLESPTVGTVKMMIDGQLSTTDTATIHQRRQVAMVFQRPFLMSRTVYQNVSYGLRIRGCDNPAAVQEALERVSLTGLANAQAHHAVRWRNATGCSGEDISH